MNKSILIAAAIAGLTMTACSTTGGHSSTASTAAGECHGVNSCKGKGECGGAGHACAGKNTCKGQGWIKISKADCDKQNGKFKAEPM